jgi:hypothetical protein
VDDIEQIHHFVTYNHYSSSVTTYGLNDPGLIPGGMQTQRPTRHLIQRVTKTFPTGEND